MGNSANSSVIRLGFTALLALGLITVVMLGVPRSSQSLTQVNKVGIDVEKRTASLPASPLTSTPSFTYYFPIIQNYYPPQWKFIGPNNLPIKQVSISGNSQETLYVVPDTTQLLTMTMLYKSNDRGSSWMSISNGISGRAQSLFAQPVTPTALLVGTVAGSNGVFQSEDGGQHWNQAGLDSFIRTVAAHPITPTLWLAAAYNSLIFGSAYIFRTENSGTNWRQVTPETTVVDSFAFDPDDRNHVYACAWSGFLSSEDAGVTWSIIAPYGCSDLVIHPYTHTLLYAASSTSILKTEDKGMNWTPILTAAHSFVGVALDQINSGQIYAATWDALFRSTDQGNSWQQIPLPSGVGALRISDLVEGYSGELYMGTDHGVWSTSLH